MHSHALHWPKLLWTLGIIVVLAVVYDIAPMPFEKPYIDPGFVAAVTILLILPLFYLALGAGLVMRHDERMRAREMLGDTRSEEHTSELQSPVHLVCRLLLEKKKKNKRMRGAKKV